MNISPVNYRLSPTDQQKASPRPKSEAKSEAGKDQGLVPGDLPFVKGEPDSSATKLRQYAKGFKATGENEIGYAKPSLASVSYGVLEAGKSIKSRALRSLVYDLAIETIAKGITSPTSVVLASIAKEAMTSPKFQDEATQVALGHSFLDEMRKFDANTYLPTMVEAGHYLATGNFKRYQDPSFSGGDDAQTPTHLGAAAMRAAMGSISQVKSAFLPDRTIAMMAENLLADPSLQSKDKNEKVMMGTRVLDQVVGSGMLGGGFDGGAQILGLVSQKAIGKMTSAASQATLIDSTLAAIKASVSEQRDQALLQFSEAILSKNVLADVKDRAQFAFSCVEVLAGAEKNLLIPNSPESMRKVGSDAALILSAARALSAPADQLKVLRNYMKNDYSRW